ncbi:MAG: rRNA maturation RNase YbeY [Candidatus Omnitrophica bacterium]|nr:rRNA maturation RNase YbeY [Candidatus Omnitrophota bacterium]
MKLNIIDLQKELTLNKKKLRKLTNEILKGELRNIKGEINLVFVNDNQIRKINSYFLKKNVPTDVLSFNESSDKKNFFGEVIISTQRAKINAKRYKTNPIYEVYLYIIHGILHLLGYKDRKIEERKRMNKKTKEILSRLKFIN